MARRVPDPAEPHGGATRYDPRWLSWDGGHAGIRDPGSVVRTSPRTGAEGRDPRGLFVLSDGRLGWLILHSLCPGPECAADFNLGFSPFTESACATPVSQVTSALPMQPALSAGVQPSVRSDRIGPIDNRVRRPRAAPLVVSASLLMVEVDPVLVVVYRRHANQGIVRRQKATDAAPTSTRYCRELYPAMPGPETVEIRNVLSQC